MSNYSPTGFRMMPTVVKNLLIINVLMFIGTLVAESKFGIDLNRILGLYYPGSSLFRPYQIVSYMFMHGGFTHILFNMFALWMFGSAIENVWGSKRFFIYYFVTGIGAALLNFVIVYFRIASIEAVLSPEQIDLVYKEGSALIQQGMNYSDYSMGSLNLLLNISTVGASGAVFGLLLAFGMLFPNSLIYVYFAIPVKAKWFVVIYGAIELYSGIANNPGDNVAHFAHLGGMLFGFILIKYWKNKQFKRFN